jgi:hypothetical protein
MERGLKDKDIKAAMKDPKVKKTITKNFKKGEIQLIDPKSAQPVFTEEDVSLWQ